MSLDFASQRGELKRRRLERLARKTHGLPFLRRLDPALLVLFGIAAFLLLAFWSISVAAGWRIGLFDPALIRALPDERILTNVRDEIGTRPFLAAAVHQGRLYVSQAGGEVHRFHPATELWTTVRPWTGEVGDLVSLRSGCGADPASQRGDCADAESLWARSAAGALARLRGGRWSTVFSETAFVDLQGRRPSMEDVTAAALSADGRWLLLGTRNHGVGLFDQQNRVWLPFSPAELVALPSTDVAHLRWWKDRFWIGGSEGLAHLLPDGSGGRIDVRKDVRGTVVDLDAAEALWILETRTCEEEDDDAAKRCLRLSRLSEPEGNAEALIEESRRYPQLDLELLSVAQLQQGAAPPREEPQEELLVVAGGAGLFSYDARRRSWTQHMRRSVSAHWWDPRGGLYLGTDDSVTHFAGGRIRREWSLEKQHVERLQPGSNGEMLALTSDRHIWSLRPDGEVSRVFASSWTAFDPATFSDATALAGGKVLFRAPEGMMLHDAFRRTYQDFDRDALPSWLFNPEGRLVIAGERIFAFMPPNFSRQSILVTNTTQMATGDYDEPGRVPAPVEVTAAWGDEGLAMIAGDGSAYLARQQTVERLTGGTARSLESARWNDVALDGNRLSVATDKGLRTYRLDRRSWRDWTLPGTSIKELALAAGQLTLLTGDSQLAGPDPDDPFLIGGPHEDWRISDSGLADARLVRGQVYLAGDGWVSRYDPERRRLVWQWRLSPSTFRPGSAGAGAPRLRLVDVIGMEPLSWTGTSAFLGSVELDPDAGPVLGLSLGRRFIWTVRDNEGQRYLKGYGRNRPFEAGFTRCLFRHPSAGFARPLDARPVRPGLVAVATTRGLKLYSRETRSWYDVTAAGQPLLQGLQGTEDGVLFKLDETLALRAGGRLTFLDTDDLTVLHGCSRSSTIDVTPILSVRASAVAFDEEPGKSSAVWIAQDGAVRGWRSGSRKTLLAAPAGAPPTRRLKRVFRFGHRLVFTARASLHVYDLGSHAWSTYRLGLSRAQTEAVSELNLEDLGGNWTLTVSLASGAVYVGLVDPGTSFDPGTSEPPRIPLTEVLPARQQRRGALGTDPGTLLDVQWRLGRWAFVLTDRLVVFDPETRRWDDPAPFPGDPDPTLSLRQAVGIDVLVKQDGREWWIEQGTASDPTFARFEPADDLATAIDEEARVWRLRPGGRVEKCEARGRAYTCGVEIAADPANPVTALEKGLTGRGLFARRGSGPVELTAGRAELALRLPPAVDTGWFAWQRDGEGRPDDAGRPDSAGQPDGAGGTFRVATPSGPKTFSRQEFIRGGRLLFEDVRAVLAETPYRLHAATPNGVWTFPAGSLSVARRAGPGSAEGNVVFLPADLGDDVRAVHGRFLTPTHSLQIRGGEVGGGRLRPDPYPEHRVRLRNRVTFVERTRERTVSGTIEALGDTIPAFDEAGLRWDRRRGIARHPRQGWLLLTAAGLHPLSITDRRNVFDLGPTRQAHRAGRLLSAAGPRPILYDGDQAYMLDDSGWRPVRAGEQVFDRTVVDTAFWSWQRRGERLSVTLKAPPSGSDFGLRSGPAGWQLTSDRLRAAAFHRDRMFLITEAFLEVTAESLDPRDATARFAAVAADEMESLSPGPRGPPELYVRDRDGTGRTRNLSRWDEASTSFRRLTPAQDPRRNRDLVLQGRLRLRLRDGQVVKDLRVEDADTAAPLWKRFRMSRRGFSFDEVSAIGTVDDRLLVHTAAGLQVYRAGGGTGLADAKAVYDLPGTSVRLGRPADEPDRFFVVAGNDCYEWQGGLKPCDRRRNLATRWRGESDLWRFTIRDRWLRGFYKDTQGRVTAKEVAIEDGRLPHDHLRDLVACEGSAASLWNSGWITLHKDPTLSLKGARNLDGLVRQRPRSVFCVRYEGDAEKIFPESPSEPRLAAGLYAYAAPERFWHWNGEAWDAVTDTRLRQIIRRPPFQEFGRLRLTRPSGSAFLYQYRNPDGEWIDLPWRPEEGRLAIDVIDDVQVVDGTLWALTPAGLTAFARGTDGTLRLDPETLTVIRAPLVDDRPCRITDFEFDDTRAGDGLAEDGQADVRRVVVRCGNNSRKVFARRVGERPVGERPVGERPVGGTDEVEPSASADAGFQPYSGSDPFVERVFVTQEASGFWDWRLIDRRDGHSGTLVAQLRGEPVSLSQGRFDFDYLSSVAVASPQRIELTSAVSGWYRQPQDSFHLRDLSRPEVGSGVRPDEVTRVALSLEDGATRLPGGTTSPDGTAPPGASEPPDMTRLSEVENGRPVTRLSDVVRLSDAKRLSDVTRLCVETQPGTAFLLEDGAIVGNARECSEHLGRDSLWSYDQFEGRVRVRSPGVAGGWALRTLRAGRLSDQIVLGPPITGSEASETFHLVPTEAGVLRLDAQGVPRAAYAPEHEGLERGDLPAVLYLDQEGRAVYVTETGVRDLESGEVVSSESFRWPEEAVPEALEDGPENMLRLDWRRGREKGWTLLQAADYASVDDNVLPVNAGEWGRFVRGRIGWDDPSAVLGLRLLTDGLQLFTQQKSRRFQFPWVGSFRPIALIPYGPRLFVVEAGEISELRLDVGVEELFR